MKISVAMCTYNGEKYIKEQLESILSQTIIPDELVVCDDVSKDKTWMILEEFKKKAQISVRLVRNKTNLGSNQNFAKAISLCTGDIIFLSDQDDIWLPHKVEAMVKVFAAKPDIGMVFSDALVVDQNLKPNPKTLWQYFGVGNKVRKMALEGNLWTILGANSYVTGATMAFRSKLRYLFEPIPDIWVHDGWITLMIDLVSRIGLVDETLIMYRQHGTQQIGVPLKAKGSFHRAIRKKVFPAGHRRKCQNQIERMDPVISHISGFRDSLRDPHMFDYLQEQIDHWRMRDNLPKDRRKRLSIIRREYLLGRYRKYSGTSRMAIKDLLGS